jgi:hypothetical protein
MLRTFGDSGQLATDDLTEYVITTSHVHPVIGSNIGSNRAAAFSGLMKPSPISPNALKAICGICRRPEWVFPSSVATACEHG